MLKPLPLADQYKVVLRMLRHDISDCYMLGVLRLAVFWNGPRGELCNNESQIVTFVE